MTQSARLVMSAVAILTVVGCSKTYVVTRPLDQPLATPVTIGVGAITDELPSDMPQEKKPKPEDLEKLRRYLQEEIEKRKSWRLASEPQDSLNHEVQGSLLEFKRGSGALRFFVGFGAGNARATMALKLIDKPTGEVLFSGNFYGSVTSWAESGDQTFRQIAANFAKQLEKQSKSTAGQR